MAMADISAPQLAVWYIENILKYMEETEQQTMYQLEWQVEHWPSLCLVIEQTCQQKPTLVNHMLPDHYNSKTLHTTRTNMQQWNILKTELVNPKNIGPCRLVFQYHELPNKGYLPINNATNLGFKILDLYQRNVRTNQFPQDIF